MSGFRTRPHPRVCLSIVFTFTVALGFAVAGNARSEEPSAGKGPYAEIETLRREVATLRQRDEENRARLAELEKMLGQVLEARGHDGQTVAPEVDASAALDAALEAAGASLPIPTANVNAALGSNAPPPTGAAGALRLIDTSFVTLVAGGGSSLRNDELSELQRGGHDPNKNGFTLQQAELSLSGMVDPYFTGEAHIVATTEGLELEEAFFTTSALPHGLQVEAGYSLTEFGLINPLHAHAWDWMDQPIVVGRMFGGEGTRAPGARVGWLLPTPFFSELHAGVQNADEGEFTPSFAGEEGIGGRPNVGHETRSASDLLWLLRSNASWDLGEETTLLLGLSGLYGPNGTGPDGDTRIYGADLKIRWRPNDNFRGWPFLLLQAEAIARDYRADEFTTSDLNLNGTAARTSADEIRLSADDSAAVTLHDNGYYAQALYGFRYGWAAGLRAEYATGSGDSIAAGQRISRSKDSLRDDRLRLSPLLTWQPTEFSRLRLQYNYDRADHLDNHAAHTVWISGEVLYGQHAAHKY